VGQLYRVGGDLDVLFIGMVRAIHHHAGVAVVDARLDEVEGVAVVAVNRNRQARILFDGGVDDSLEVADIGVFAGALADLEDHRAGFLGTGIDDRLRQFHVVDVEGTDGKPAIVGEVEHRFGCHQRHITSPRNARRWFDRSVILLGSGGRS
jgi:hypothetical protein